MVSIREVIAKLISVNSAKSYDVASGGMLPAVSVGDVEKALDMVMPALYALGVPESVTPDDEACDRWGCCWGGIDNTAEILADLTGQASLGDRMAIKEVLEKVVEAVC